MTWQEHIDALRGTSGMSNDEELEALFLNAEFCAMVDEQIFECTVCGWWCDISEEESDGYGLDDLTCSQCCEEQS